MTASDNKSGWKGPLEASCSNSLFTAEPASTSSLAPKLDHMAWDLACSSTISKEWEASPGTCCSVWPLSFWRAFLYCQTTDVNWMTDKKSDLLHFCWIGKMEWGKCQDHTVRSRGNCEVEHRLIDGHSQGTCLTLPSSVPSCHWHMLVHSFPTTCWPAMFLFCHLLSCGWSLCSRAVNQRGTVLLFQLSALVPLQPAVLLALDSKKVF